MQEGYACGEVSQSVDPVWYVFAAEDVGKGPREVVAVFVHQVVAVAAELFAQLLQDLVDVGRPEVGVAQPDGDLEAELFR